MSDFTELDVFETAMLYVVSLEYPGALRSSELFVV